MTAHADYYAVYHDNKDNGLYSDVTPVHHTVVREAMPFIRDALGEYTHLKSRIMLFVSMFM